MNKTIGILAHVDAGKTTLAEQILFYTNSIRVKGRVDHKNSFLDSHEIEKNRGITVFSDQAIFNYKGDNYYLVDTPGHIDFSTEMERAIEIMDYAIIVVSAMEGVQSHTETVWNLLRKYNVPTFFFINKIDRVGADVPKVIEEIQEKLTKNLFYVEGSGINSPMDLEAVEFIAEQDDELFEYYLEKGYNHHIWKKEIIKLIKDNAIFPCCSGSALQEIGVSEFLDTLHELTYTEYNSDDIFSGVVYKVRHDEQGGRITYIKSLSGVAKVKDQCEYKFNGEIIKEKINQIRIYNGVKYKTSDNVAAGEIFAITGITNAKPGDGVGALEKSANYEIVPTLKSKVIYDKSINPQDVLSKFKILEAEDPSLDVTWDENLKEIHVNIMGTIQLEVLKQVVSHRFKLNIEFGECEILYKETISDSVRGCGHFEPLRHYAEVHLRLEPAPRNSGITFESECHVDDLPLSYQNLVKSHVFERTHKGILTGSPLTDVKITLLIGRYHEKHTSGGDFREATYRAIRQGLEKASNVLLEPYYSFKIDVELEYMGKVLSDIQRMHGNFNTPETNGNKAIIIGTGPVATFMNYSAELVSFTKGKGIINLAFHGYYPCHNREEIIEKISYNKNADMNHTSSSVFCSHGQGFIVEWDSADDYMHC